MIPIPSELRFETRIHGRMNGHPFELRGGGFGTPYNGMLTLEMRSTTGPVPFHIMLMPELAGIGYPTFGNYQEGCVDLFKISDGYEYDRNFKFEDGGWMNSRHTIQYVDGDKLIGDFQVDGEVTAPDLASFEPYVDVWIPDGPGRIRSSSVLVWKTQGGRFYRAAIEGEYRLTHRRELPFVQVRHGRLETQFSEDWFESQEWITVYRDFSSMPPVTWEKDQEPLVFAKV